MNQILNTQMFKKNKKNIRKFKILLCFSLFSIVLFSVYWFYSYNSSDNKNVSEGLLSNFNIERLYSYGQDYTTVILNENNDFFVIGIIEISKINVKYPILSKVNDDLLKVSTCRFYGPYPNEVGNLCIAGHNYDDDRFFSNLYKLNIGDTINIYDLNNFVVSYNVYDKFEVSENNTSATNQNTNNKREITLVTCNNVTKNRLIIKAKEKT